MIDRERISKAEQFTKPGTANVSPRDLEKLRPLIEHYRKNPHPFRACYRDQIKHGLTPGHAARRCAVLKDLMMGTTSWRKGNQSGLKKDLGGFDQLEAELEIEEALEQLNGTTWDRTVKTTAAQETRRSLRDEMLGGLRKAAGPFDPKQHPRWPKGTPGIGGQFRPDGMPDSSATIAASALGRLDSGNTVHAAAAKAFNAAAKDVDWEKESDPDAKTRDLLKRRVISPLRGQKHDTGDEARINAAEARIDDPSRGMPDPARIAEGNAPRPHRPGLRIGDEDIGPKLDSALDRARTGSRKPRIEEDSPESAAKPNVTRKWASDATDKELEDRRTELGRVNDGIANAQTEVLSPAANKRLADTQKKLAIINRELDRRSSSGQEAKNPSELTLEELRAEARALSDERKQLRGRNRQATAKKLRDFDKSPKGKRLDALDKRISELLKRPRPT